MNVTDDDVRQTAREAAGEIRQQRARIAELEATLFEIHASTRRMSFQTEWYLEGVRNPPGDYVLMRIGPACPEGEIPF